MFAICGAPFEGEDRHGVAAVGGSVGLDMAVQMGHIAHLVMTDGGIAPTGVNTAGKARAVTPEAISLRVTSAGMGVCFAENDFL